MAYKYQPIKDEIFVSDSEEAEEEEVEEEGEEEQIEEEFDEVLITSNGRRYNNLL